MSVSPLVSSMGGLDALHIDLCSIVQFFQPSCSILVIYDGWFPSYMSPSSSKEKSGFYIGLEMYFINRFERHIIWWIKFELLQSNNGGVVIRYIC